MLSINDCQTIVNQHLNEIYIPGLPENLYDPVKYMLKLDAKRIRPSLVLMACNIFNDDIKAAIYPALAIEFFHNFTLVHDDIMDKSELRRNHPTIYKKWSPNVAILSGDVMIIKAYELLTMESGEALKKILPVFNLTALMVCEGQQYDMDFETTSDVSIEDYMKMVECKTAVLIAASLKIGALAGGSDKNSADLLYEFGRNIGVAFQLQDDLLDVFADSSVFGKATGNDIVTNKKTILLIEALNRTKGKDRDILLRWLNTNTFDKREKIAAITEIYRTLNIKEVVDIQIKLYNQNALKCLDELPVETSKKTELLGFSEYLMNRNK